MVTMKMWRKKKIKCRLDATRFHRSIKSIKKSKPKFKKPKVALATSLVNKNE